MDEVHLAEPVQLFTFTKTNDADNESTVIKLNTDVIDNLISLIENRRLCVISVCGPSRQGKSFLLGYFIRCLEGLEKEVDDWMGWDDKSKPLKGFKFKNGSKPETQGIYIWSHPFIIQTEEDGEIAVLLLDTQGTYDEFTNKKDMSAIVGLSMLASSVFIFNLFTNLQEDIIEDLHTYIEYGNIAQNNNHDVATPFQKLSFLIREWNNPGEFPYGGKGGRGFLKEKLEIKEGQPKETKIVRNSIQKCFEEVDCFLLPRIGEKAILPDFNGSVEEMGQNFASQLEKFINGILDPDCLPIKKIMGKPVTAIEYKSFLQSYVEIYNSNEIPTPDMMWDATTQMFLQNLVEKSFQKFRTLIKKGTPQCGYFAAPELNAIFEKSKNASLEFFQKQNKLNGGEISLKFEEKLQKQIANELPLIEQQNATNRAQFIELVISNATSSFMKIFEDRIQFLIEDSTLFYEDSYIDESYELAKRTAIEDLEVKLSKEDEEERVKTKTSLDLIFEGHYTAIQSRNASQLKNAEKEMDTLLTTLLDAHTKALEDFFEQNKFENNDQEFFDFNCSEQDKTSDLFDNESKPGNEEFQEKYLEYLKKSMQDIFVKLHSEHDAHIKKITDEIEEIISAKLILLEWCLKDALSNLTPSLEELEKLYLEELENIKDNLDQEIEIPSDSALGTMLKDSLLKKSKKVYDSCKVDLEKKIAKLNDSYKTAAKDFYQQKMNKWINKNDIIDIDVLMTKHDEFCKQSIENYKSCGLEGKLYDPSMFLEELHEAITNEFYSYEKEVQENNKALIKETKTLYSSCLQEYENALETGINKTKSNAEFSQFHVKKRARYLNKFQEDCPVKNQKYIEKQLKRLQENFENKYKTYKELLEFRQTENQVKMQRVLFDAHKLYHDDMENKNKNDTFSTLESLQKNHDTIKTEVFKRCISKTLNLSEAQKSELNDFLESQVVIWLEKYFLDSKDQTTDPAIGIDLGTTYCCVAVYYKGKVHLVPNQQNGGDLTTPSYIAFDNTNTETFGATAKENAFRNPENTIFDVKRIIGRKFEDPVLQSDIKYWPFTVEKHENVPKILVNGQYLYPEQISGKLLMHFRKMAEEFLQLKPGSIKKAVITVPAYFNDGQRQATRDAGELARLQVLKILTEPTAAALAYNLERLNRDPKNILIYDLGGGTFDVSILEMTEAKNAVLGVGGDTHLGGEDFDKNLMEYCAAHFLQQNGVDLLKGKDSQEVQERYESRRSLRRLQAFCERAKKDLTGGRVAEISADALKDGIDFNISITREKFEELNEKYFKQTIEIVDETLRNVGLLKEDIDDVVLVGGSSRIPRVQELLTEYFDGKILNKSIHPDHAVAYGAAVQAALLNGDQSSKKFLDIEIDDVIPMTIGVEVYSKKLAVFLPKNTKYPVEVQRVHKTVFDNQTSVEFCVYQGENIKVAAANQLLGRFTIDGIPPKPAGEEKFDVTMKIDSAGILHVTAVSKSTKNKNGITVRENKQRMSEQDKRRALFQ